jgi:4-amino-4-deoxy-L-arabinose transferase-like glycosyltransferase
LARAGLVVCIAVAVAARVHVGSPLWLDEALSVNIASLPLGDVLTALRHDGHPPLYYLLLHAWMHVAGDGDDAVRLLSGVLSIASLPVAYVAGARLGNRVTGAWTVVLIGLTPFCVRYGTEARMYALVMLLVLAGDVLIRDALHAPSTARLAGVAVISGALLLTHYWAIWLLGSAFVALLLAWRRGTPAALRVAVAVAAGGVLFLPWLPGFLDQLGHTGTPWGTPFRPSQAAAATLSDLGGSGFTEAILFGVVLVLLVVLGVFGRRTPSGTIDLDLNRPTAVGAEVGVAVATLVVGSVAGYLTDATFATRYASVFLPLVLLAAAAGLAQLPTRHAAVAGALVVGLSVAGIAENATTDRTQAGIAARAIATRAHAGDVVVYCPDQLAPAVSRELGRRTRGDVVELAYPALLPGTRVDWRDYTERIAATSPDARAATALDRAGSHNVFVVWSGQYRTHTSRCEALLAALARARGPAAELVTADPNHYFESASVDVFAAPA